MLNNVHAKISNLFRRNTEPSAVDIIKEHLTEKRPLPIGVKEFGIWSNRIIEGAMVKADPESQKFALAAMILQLGSKDTFKDDLFFISQLRKSAMDQTAQYMMKEIKDTRELRAQQNQGAVTPPSGASSEVLRDEAV